MRRSTCSPAAPNPTTGLVDCAPSDCPFYNGTQVYLQQVRGIFSSPIAETSSVDHAIYGNDNYAVQPLCHLQPRPPLGRGTAQRRNPVLTSSTITGLPVWASISTPLAIVSRRSSSIGDVTPKPSRRMAHCAICRTNSTSTQPIGSRKPMPTTMSSSGQIIPSCRFSMQLT